VSFYIRDAQGVWQWHYLTHDGPAWRATAVEFTPAAVRIMHQGVLAREIPRRGAVILQSINGEKNNQPAVLTASALVAAHNEKFSQ
jgi:hypothetical protein